MAQIREAVASSKIELGNAAWMQDQTFRFAALTSVAVSIAYYGTARIGFNFTLQPGSISLLWMPNALLLAGLLLIARSWWWLLILAAFPAHIVSEWQSGVPGTMALSWFVSNTLQAWLGAEGIRRLVKRDLRFDSTRDLTYFFACGVFIAPLVASFVDAGLVRLNGWGEGSFWDIWHVRFLSNVIATLTIVPCILLWVRDGWTVLRRARLSRSVEALALTVSLFAVGTAVFNNPGEFIQNTPRVYWPFPFLLWATVRFGPMGITNALVLVMFLAIGGVTKGTGPFVTASVEVSALAIQVFLIVLSIPLMTLAAVMEERRQAVIAARDNEEHLKFALDAGHLNTWEWRRADKRLKWPAPGHAGFAKNGGIEESREAAETLIHPEDQEALEAAVSRASADSAPCEVEFRVIQNRMTRWFLSKGKVYRSNTGDPIRMLGIGMDITRRKHAEQALSEITSRNQAILRALPDLMFLLDTDGTYLDCYTRDSSQLLVPPSSFLGKNVREVLPPELAERVMQSLVRLREGDPCEVLDYALPIGGEERHYEARLVTARANQVLTIVRDITKEWRAVEAARQSQEKLRQSNNQIRDLAARLITAQESERRRISLLLHDDVSQNIAVMGLGISRLKSRTSSNEEVATGLEELEQQTLRLGTQIRDLSHELHPGVLEHLGLVAALRSHVREVNQEKKIEASFTARVGPEPIPPDIAVCLYRVAREALHNALRHSGAASASIELHDEDGLLTLKVSDSGRGFDVEAARWGAGIGLASAEERIRLLQGSFEVRSNSLMGTVLIARVPRSV